MHYDVYYKNTEYIDCEARKIMKLNNRYFYFKWLFVVCFLGTIQVSLATENQQQFQPYILVHEKLAEVLIRAESLKIRKKVEFIENHDHEQKKLGEAHELLEKCIKQLPNTQISLELGKKLKSTYQSSEWNGCTGLFDELLKSLEDKKYSDVRYKEKDKIVKSGTMVGLFDSPTSYSETFVPNGFTCALSFVGTDDISETVYVTHKFFSDMDTFESSREEIDGFEVFYSGEDDDKKVASKSDLYKPPIITHSEPKAYFCLAGNPVIKLCEEAIKKLSKPVKSIVFHGCTLRDMCSNCFESLQKQFDSQDKELTGNFIQILNKTITKYNKENLYSAPVKFSAIISSLLEYKGGAKNNPQISQIRFSEEIFLKTLILELKKSVKENEKYLPKILETLKINLEKK